MRILTSIHIEKDVLQQAKALGLNISRFTETKLSEFVKTQQSTMLGGVAACGGPDSNRRTPAGTDPKSVTFDLARQPPLAVNWTGVYCFSS